MCVPVYEDHVVRQHDVAGNGNFRRVILTRSLNRTDAAKLARIINHVCLREGCAITFYAKDAIVRIRGRRIKVGREIAKGQLPGPKSVRMRRIKRDGVGVGDVQADRTEVDCCARSTGWRRALNSDEDARTLTSLRFLSTTRY